MAAEHDPSQIWVTHLIDPSTFWYLSAAEQKVCDEIDFCLNAAMKTFPPGAPGYAKITVPIPGQLAAVKDRVSYQWQRAAVQACSGDTCLVFLLDHGLAKNVALSQVRPLPPGELFQRGPCATWIQLRHVAPVTTVVFVEKPPERREGKDWDPAAYKFIADKLASAEAAYLVTDGNSFEMTKDGLFGQILLDVDGQVADLGDMLVANEYATKSDHFNIATRVYQAGPNCLQLGPNPTDRRQFCTPMSTDSLNQDKEESMGWITTAASRRNRSQQLLPTRHTEEGGGDAPQAKPRTETSYLFCPAGGNINDYIQPQARAGRARLASPSGGQDALTTPVRMPTTKPVRMPTTTPVCMPSTGGDTSRGTVSPLGPVIASPVGSSSLSISDVAAPSTSPIAQSQQVVSSPPSTSPIAQSQQVVSSPPSTSPIAQSQQVVSSPPSTSPIAQSQQVVSSPSSAVSPRPDVDPADLEISPLQRKSMLLKKRLNLETPVQETVQEMSVSPVVSLPIHSPPVRSLPPNDVSRLNLEAPVQETVQEMESASSSVSPVVSPLIHSPPVRSLPLNDVSRLNLEAPVQETVQEMESTSSSVSPVVSPPIHSPPVRSLPPNDISPLPNDMNCKPSALTKRSLLLQQRFNLKSPECESMKEESSSAVASSGNIPASVAGVAKSGGAAAVLDQVAPGHMPSEAKSPTQAHRRVAQPSTVGITDLLDVTRVLVHGKPVDKLNEVASASFPPVVHKGLSCMNVTALKPLQSYAWPAILQGESVVMVNQKGGGKTLGYLVPLLSRLMVKVNYKQFVKKSNGPFALILCSGARSCEMVYDTCVRLVGRSPSVKVLLTHGGGAELEMKSALTNGCDLLISTPRCFLRLLAYSKYLVNLHRLCHLVVDEADVMLDKFLPELRTVLASCKSAAERRLEQGVAVDCPLQLVMAAEHWSTQLYVAVHAISPDPLVLIGSYLEAAIYAHIRPKLEIMEKDKKLDTVLGILSGTKGLYKTVIVCRDKSEAEPLFSHLIAELPDMQFLLIHEDILGPEIQDVRCQWQAGGDGNYPVLVCTDAAVLQDMTISDARLLVHYNLPSKRTPFGARFTLLMDSYPDIHVEAGAQPDCMVHILVDGSNTTQLPGIVDLMRRLGASILPIVQNIIEGISLDKERAKTDLPLCYNLKAFGECWDAKACVNRHVIIEADRPVDIPTQGRVRLKVVSVLDTCCFAARLLEVTNADGLTEPVQDDYVSLAMELALWFGSSGADEEPRVHGTTRVGDVCALEVTPGLFERVKVMQVTRLNSYEQPAEVTVLMLDSGVEKRRVSPLRLLALPERLQDVAPQVVTVFLCRLVPGDNDLNYSLVSYKKMCRWIYDAEAQEAEGTFLVGDIRLSLGHTLWLDPLHIKQSLRSVDAEVVGVALRRQLIRDHVAVDNPGHLEPLYALCRAVDIDFPEPAAAEAQELAPTNGTGPLPTPRWAHLPASAPRPPVVMVSADSPGVVFVRRHDLQPSLTRLTRDMQAQVAGRGKKVTSYGGAGLVIAAGALCLGRSDQDGMWHRTRVTGVTEEGGVELFFVDYGDRRTVDAATDITPIEERFVTVLPFQAIECSLFGLAPLESDPDAWSTAAVDLIYDLTVWETNGTARLLDYEIYVTDAEATCTGGRRYAVALIDQCAGDNQDSVLNRVLLEEGLAQAVEDEISFLGDLPRSVPPRTAEEPPPEADLDVKADAGGKEEFVRLADLKGKRASALNETDELKLADGETCFDVEIDDIQRFIFDMVNGRNKQAAQQLAAINSLPAPPQRPALCAPPPLKECSPPKQAKMVPSVDGQPRTMWHQTTDKPKQDKMVPSVDGQPRVVWHQDMNEVHLSVELVDVVSYQLQAEVMGLTLTADTADFPGHRRLQIDLFGAVDPRRTEHDSTGRTIKVKMMKLYAGTWPHLLQQPDKCYYWLRYNIEHTVAGSGQPEEEEVDSDLVEERARAALAAAAVAMSPTNNKDNIQPDFQYNDSSSESENSDFAEDDKPFEFNDFHDPLT